MSRLIQRLAVLDGAFVIIACQGDVGPDQSLLIGTRAQQGAAQTDPIDPWGVSYATSL